MKIAASVRRSRRAMSSLTTGAIANTAVMSRMNQKKGCRTIIVGGTTARRIAPAKAAYLANDRKGTLALSKIE
jgi:hypothetical protein